jgi:hypothetical protein
MVMAGWVALNGSAEVRDPRLPALLKEEWSRRDEAPCPGLRPGAFYEVAGGEESAELYYALSGEVVSRQGSWPEEPRHCREISEPSNIEELK